MYHKEPMWILKRASWCMMCGTTLPHDSSLKAIEYVGYPTQKPEQLISRLSSAGLHTPPTSSSTASSARAPRRRRRRSSAAAGSAATSTRAPSKPRASGSRPSSRTRSRRPRRAASRPFRSKTARTSPPAPGPARLHGLARQRLRLADPAQRGGEPGLRAHRRQAHPRRRVLRRHSGQGAGQDHPLQPPAHAPGPRRDQDGNWTPGPTRTATSLVCLGKELAAAAWVEDWNRLRKGQGRGQQDRRDRAAHRPALRQVHPARARHGQGQDHAGEGHDQGRQIEDFISPTIIERLREQAGVLTPEDRRLARHGGLRDDRHAYDGQVFNVVLADVPEKKTDFVNGAYELPAPKGKTTVAVKIVDMLGV